MNEQHAMQSIEKSNVLVENLFCKYFVYGEQRKDIKCGQKQKQNVSRPDR